MHLTKSKSLLYLGVLLFNLGVLLVSTKATATVGPPYGSNCTGGCGIGSHIIPSSVHVYLWDSADANDLIEAGTAISDYDMSKLPLTLDSTSLWLVYDTDVNSDGCGVVGAQLNNSDRKQCEYDANGLKVIGLHHKVPIHGLVPASHQGNAGGGLTLYAAANINATPTSRLGNYDLGSQSHPGPEAVQGGTYGYLNVFTPNPTAQMPMTFTIDHYGVVSATRGHQAEIPLNILWNGGNTSGPISGLPCDAAHVSFLGHTYAAGQWSAANSGQWFTCKQTSPSVYGWVANTSLPALVATSSSIIDGAGNVYSCPGSVSGGEDNTSASPVPNSVCGATQTSVTPFYAGAWVHGGTGTNYRQVHYNLLGYWVDMNGLAVPLSPAPNALLEYFATAGTGMLGNMTVKEHFVVYTDSSLTTPAGGTPQIDFSYTINVHDDVEDADADPTSYPPIMDAPQYFNYYAQEVVGMANDRTGSRFSEAFAYQNLGFYPGSLTMGASDWGQNNLMQYDMPKVDLDAMRNLLGDLFGAAWPGWTAGTAYGDRYETLFITPTGACADPNGNTWIATINGAVAGTGCPNWASIPTPDASKTLTDGAQKWKNIGNKQFYLAYANDVVVPYVNHVDTNGGGQQWADFPFSMDMLAGMTGDAVKKGNTVVPGFYSHGIQTLTGSSGVGAFDQFSNSAGRGVAYDGDKVASFADVSCRAGNCAAFSGNAELKARLRWDQNSCINYFDIHELSDPNDPDWRNSSWPTFDPLHIGVCTEMLWKVWVVSNRWDPNDTWHVRDNRTWTSLKGMLDFAWTHWFNQCRVQGEGQDNWSLSYNPMDVQTCAILEPHFTELIGPMAAMYYVYGRQKGNPNLSDGTTYFAAGDRMLWAKYLGRNCSSAIGRWECSQVNIPYAGGSGTPKTAGQTMKLDALCQRLGKCTAAQDDTDPAFLPCWDTGTVPCNGPHPLPDTLAAYGAQRLPSGLQDDAGCESHFTGQACSPIQLPTANDAWFQIVTYDELQSIAVQWGTDTTCSTGSSTTEKAGYPQPLTGVAQFNMGATHMLHMTPLNPSTHYWARCRTVDTSGNVFVSPCAAIPGGWRGGGINFTTAAGGPPPPPPSLTLAVSPKALTVPEGQKGTATLTTTIGNGFASAVTLSASGMPSGVQVAIVPTLLPMPGAGSAIATISVASTVAAGSYPITFNASNGTAAAPSVASFVLTVSGSGPALTVPPQTFNATVGVAFNGQLAAQNGVPPYLWVSATPMPAGLKLATSGAVTGIPTTAGAPQVKVTAVDQKKSTAQGTVTFNIAQPGCIWTILPAKLPPAQQNHAYSAALSLSCPSATPVSWTVTSGALPSGITLSSAGFLQAKSVSAKPATYAFTVQAQDQQKQQTAASRLSIQVKPGSSIGGLVSKILNGSGIVATRP